jgi:spore coat protein U-like protein
LAHRHVIAAAAASALLGAGGQAAAADATATASVELINLQEIYVSKVSDISFGTILKPTSGILEVTIEPGGGRSASGGAGGELIGAGSSSARFDVGGDGGRTFTITLPPSVTLTKSGGGANRQLTLSPEASTTDTLSGTSGQFGAKQIEVTGSLEIPSTVESGAYAGHVPVTVAYQ